MAVAGGCAAGRAPVNGMPFTFVSAPITATTNTVATKEGTGHCTSVLGIVAFGDCSIATAAEEAGITKIMTVDHDYISFLGFFADYHVIVKGE